MGADTYSMTMWTMAVIAVFVFIALYFVKAGYGIFRTKQWGLSINNKAAWVMMEAPVCFSNSIISSAHLSSLL